MTYDRRHLTRKLYFSIKTGQFFTPQIYIHSPEEPPSSSTELTYELLNVNCIHRMLINVRRIFARISPCRVCMYLHCVLIFFLIADNWNNKHGRSRVASNWEATVSLPRGNPRHHQYTIQLCGMFNWVAHSNRARIVQLHPSHVTDPM